MRPFGDDTIEPLRDILDELAHEDPVSDHGSRDIVDAMRRHLGMDYAFVSEFVGQTRILRLVSCDGPGGPKEGRRDPAEGTLCAAVLAGEMPEYANEVSALPASERYPLVRELGLAAYIEVPIWLPGGALYGAFCCYSKRPHHSLDDRDLALMRAVAGLLGQRIWRQRKVEAENAEFRATLDATIASDRIELVCQDIVCTKGGDVHGKELLCRFPAFGGKSPRQILDRARRVAPGIKLDLAVLRRALSLTERASAGLFFVNIWPDLLLDPGFFRTLERAPLPVVVEMIEDDTRMDLHRLREAAARLRRFGHAVALDDIGTGLSNLGRLVEIRPDYLKLDRSLVSGIHRDPGRRTLIEGLVRFSEVVGGKVIAEGVEERQEWESLQSIGVPFAQGYYFGRPAPVAAG